MERIQQALMDGKHQLLWKILKKMMWSIGDKYVEKCKCWQGNNLNEKEVIVCGRKYFLDKIFFRLKTFVEEYIFIENFDFCTPKTFLWWGPNKKLSHKTLLKQNLVFHWQSGFSLKILIL